MPLSAGGGTGSLGDWFPCAFSSSRTRVSAVFTASRHVGALAGAELNPGAKAPSGRCTWGLGLASAPPRVPAGLSCPSSPAIIKIRS